MKKLLNFAYMEASLVSFFKVFKSLHSFISQKYTWRTWPRNFLTLYCI